MNTSFGSRLTDRNSGPPEIPLPQEGDDAKRARNKRNEADEKEPL